MRFDLKKLLAAVLIACLAGAGPALAAKPTVVRAGDVILRLNGGVGPKSLPRRRLAPISLRVAAHLGTTDGSQPPAMRTVTVDFDRHGTINARGLPACRLGQLEARPTRAARKACRSSLVGTGKTKVRVALAESRPFTASGPLLLFNGGVRRGVTTMYIHAYVSVPVATAVVSVVRIHRIRKGPYGTRAVATIPKIVGGAGSVVDFSFDVHRIFRQAGRRQSYLLARCANGRFRARAKLAAIGGEVIGGSILRPCRPLG
jgi:hypothetical protein